MVAENLKLIIEAEAGSAIATLKQFQAQTEQVKKSFDFTKTGQQMVKAGKVMSIGITAPLILAGRQAVKAYGEQEQAEAQLAAAIRSTGGDVDALMKEYRTFAAEIQSVTTVGDEQVLSLLQQARSYGIVESKMKEAVTGAIGLSKAFDVDMQTALRGVANAMEGNYETLARTVPAMRNAATAAEKNAELQEAMSNGFELAKAEALTATGQLAQLTNILSDLGEIVGKVIIPALAEAAKYVKQMALWFSNLNPETQETIVKILGLTAAMGPLLIVGGKILQNIPKMADGFNKIGEMIGMSGGQVALLTVALMALVAATILVIKNWGPITEFFENLWRKVKEIFIDAWEGIKAFVASSWPTLIGYLAGPLGTLAGKIVQNWDSIVTTFQDAFERIKEIVLKIKEWLTEKLAAIVEPVRNVANAVRDSFAWLKDTLVGHSIIPEMVDEIQVQMDRMNAALASTEGVDALRENIDQAKDAAQKMVNAIAPFSDAFGAMAMGAEDAGEAMKDAIKGAIAKILEMLALEAFARAGLAVAAKQYLAAVAWTAAGTAAMVSAGVVKAMAEGGIVTRPTHALIGERGPEAVIPLNKAGNFGTVNVYVQGSVLAEEDLSRKVLTAVRRAGRGY